QNAPIVRPLTACCANSARQPSALRRWYFLCVSDAITHDLPVHALGDHSAHLKNPEYNAAQLPLTLLPLSCRR
ncbi:MAG: hypothetical protein ACYC1J_11150, partial [Acidithiobacillus ferrooxidans]